MWQQVAEPPAGLEEQQEQEEEEQEKQQGLEPAADLV